MNLDLVLARMFLLENISAYEKFSSAALVVLVVTTVAVASVYLSSRQSGTPSSSYQQLDPNQGTDIGKSWNPPRNVECATIVNAEVSVQVDNSYTNQDETKAKLLKIPSLLLLDYQCLLKNHSTKILLLGAIKQRYS